MLPIHPILIFSKLDLKNFTNISKLFVKSCFSYVWCNPLPWSNFEMTTASDFRIFLHRLENNTRLELMLNVFDNSEEQFIRVRKF